MSRNEMVPQVCSVLLKWFLGDEECDSWPLHCERWIMYFSFRAKLNKTRIKLKLRLDFKLKIIEQNGTILNINRAKIVPPIKHFRVWTATRKEESNQWRIRREDYFSVRQRNDHSWNSMSFERDLWSGSIASLISNVTDACSEIS